jgi:integrase/recombinase XerD
MNIGNYTRKLSEYMEYKRYSKNSIKAYVACVGKFLKHFEGEATKPSEISAGKIKKFLAEFTDPNTHKAYLSAIKLFYDKVGKQPNKLDKVEYPRKSKKLPIVLSTNEIQRMFNVCENLKHKTIIALLYSCGLRLQELIDLEWQHIDRSRMIINVVLGKGNKDRQVFLPETILPLLEKYYRQYRPVKYVLNGQTEPQYTQSSVRAVVKQLAEKARINKRIYPHLLRHCTFTHMVEQGTDINLIQRIAGHSNVKTTMLYCHLSDNLISKIQSPINKIAI